MEPEIQNQTLDDVLEHKKLIAKLEDELEKKEYELSSIMKIYQDLKTVYEKTRKECTDLNTKLITSYNDKNTLEQKYENEISRLKSNYDKQKEIYVVKNFGSHFFTFSRSFCTLSHTFSEKSTIFEKFFRNFIKMCLFEKICALY